MRIKADEPQAENVLAVLLDGKTVPLVREVDTTEGWVTSYVPDLPDHFATNGEELIEDDQNQQAGFKLVRRSGNVEVKFKPTPVDD
jgi:hypothetical protein